MCCRKVTSEHFNKNYNKLRNQARIAFRPRKCDSLDHCVPLQLFRRTWLVSQIDMTE